VIKRLLLFGAVCGLLAFDSAAQSARIDIFFENDPLGADYRDASWGEAVGGDYLRLVNGSKMPVETSSASRGATSGVVEYRHAGGSFDLFIASEGWPTFDFTVIDSLVVFINGPSSIPADELPSIGLEDGNKTRSGLLRLGDYVDGLDNDVSTWQRVAVPLADIDFQSPFALDRVQTVRFANGGINPVVRTLWVDDIHAVGDASGVIPPPSPTDLETRTGDRSVIIHWQDVSAEISGYRVYRSAGGGPLDLVSGLVTRPSFVDVDVTNGVTYDYVVRSTDALGVQSEPSSPVQAVPAPLDDAAFIELVQRTAFDYFWREADPNTGHVKDRDRRDAACSIAATGMGLSAITVGIDRGWITHAQGREHVRRTLQSMWDAPQGDAASGRSGFRGFFYHFVNCSTGLRAGQSELSTIDTALLMAGVLHVREYFDEDDVASGAIRSLADDLYRRVEWTWAQVRPPRIGHGWAPGSGHFPFDYSGYDEAMILYLLALGSPTHPVGTAAWGAYTSTYQWRHYYGLNFLTFPPLFGHQYSHLWVDFRGIQDDFMRARGIDYFENSVRATRANREYAILNPMGYVNYGEDEWGLTASDIPGGYMARGAPPPQNDDGTIAPTAPGGSFAFTPELSLQALRTMYDRHRERLWGPYGFRDAYNVTQNWFATDHLGIDQGPFVIMMENHATEAIWTTFMRSEYIQTGLDRAGFRPTDVSSEPEQAGLHPSLDVYPNPASANLTVQIQGLRESGVLEVFDVLGRRVFVERLAMGGGSGTLDIDSSMWSAGVYVIRLDLDGMMVIRTVIVH
jgi:hypothetical protein